MMRFAISLIICITALLTACHLDPVPPQNTTPTTETIGYGIGNDAPYDGVGGLTTSTCGGFTVDTNNPFPCCPLSGTPASASGNCTWFVWAKAYQDWGIRLSLPPAYESSFPLDLYNYNGQRRKTQRFNRSDPTNSAFDWAHIIRTNNISNVRVETQPAINSIGVSSTVSPDGHVAWVTSVFTQNGITMVEIEEQACLGDTGSPVKIPHRKVPASYFDQGFIVYGKANVNNKPTLRLSATPATSITVGQNYSVTVIANDADGNLKQVDFNWNDGSPVESKLTVGGVDVTFTRSFSIAGQIQWSSTAYDSANASSDMLQGTFTVTSNTATNNSPSIFVESTTGSTVYANNTYSISLSANDADGNLSYIDVNWNDGTAVERMSALNNQTLTFNRAFASSRSINWSATAYDTFGSPSAMVQGTFSVITPPTSGFLPTILTTSTYCALQNNSMAVVGWTFDVQPSSQFEGQVQVYETGQTYNSGCANLMSLGGTNGACNFGAPVGEWLGRKLKIGVRETTTSGPWVYQDVTFPSVCPGPVSPAP